MSENKNTQVAVEGKAESLPSANYNEFIAGNERHQRHESPIIEDAEWSEINTNEKTVVGERPSVSEQEDLNQRIQIDETDPHNKQVIEDIKNGGGIRFASEQGVTHMALHDDEVRYLKGVNGEEYELNNGNNITIENSNTGSKFFLDKRNPEHNFERTVKKPSINPNPAKRTFDDPENNSDSSKDKDEKDKDNTANNSAGGGGVSKGFNMFNKTTNNNAPKEKGIFRKGLESSAKAAGATMAFPVKKLFEPFEKMPLEDIPKATVARTLNEHLKDINKGIRQQASMGEDLKNMQDNPRFESDSALREKFDDLLKKQDVIKEKLNANIKGMDDALESMAEKGMTFDNFPKNTGKKLSKTLDKTIENMRESGKDIVGGETLSKVAERFSEMNAKLNEALVKVVDSILRR